MKKVDFKIYTKEDFLNKYIKKYCPIDVGISHELKECNVRSLNEFGLYFMCKKCWNEAIKDIKFKEDNKATKLVEVNVADVIDNWLDEMRNAEGHCLFCKLEQEKTGYTFIDFLKENNIKMYKVGD